MNLMAGFTSRPGHRTGRLPPTAARGPAARDNLPKAPAAPHVPRRLPP